MCYKWREWPLSDIPLFSILKRIAVIFVSVQHVAQERMTSGMDTQQRLAILKKAINFDTQNGNEAVLANYLFELFKSHQIAVRTLPFGENRTNLIASLGSGNKVLALTGHMDTVSVGPRDLWDTDPLQLTAIDGKLYGRGTSDMKGGLIAFVIALIELAQEKVAIPGEVRLIVTGGEEKGQLGSAALLGKGVISDIEALIVGEPARLSNKDGRPEQQFAITAQNGTLDYEVISHGKSAHSSMPEMGVNAIDNLDVYLSEQKKYFAKATQVEDDVLGKIIPVDTLITGGEQINSVPAFAKLTTKIRTTTAYPAEQIIKELQHIITRLNAEENMDLEFHLIRKLAPVVTDNRSKIVNLVKKNGRFYFNQPVTLRSVAGTSDAATFVKENSDMSIVMIGPGNDTSHMANEYVMEEAFLNYINFIKKLILDYFNPTEN